DGSTLSDTVTVDSFLTLKTHDLSGFTDVVEVHWFQGAGPPASPTHQFSDITVSAVPTPSAVALLSIGSTVLALSQVARGMLVRWVNEPNPLREGAKIQERLHQCQPHLRMQSVRSGAGS